MTRLVLACLLSLCALSPAIAAAPPDTKNCRTLVDGQWTDRGAATARDCAAQVERDASSQDGIRFGSWGGVKVAVEQGQPYRSLDEGATWLSWTEAQAQAASEAAAVQADVAPVTASTEQAGAGPSATSGVRTAPGMAIRERVPTCQLKQGERWISRPAPSLEDCAIILDRETPPRLSAIAMAYWNSIYLAADERAIYQSSAQDGSWTELRSRSPR